MKPSFSTQEQAEDSVFVARQPIFRKTRKVFGYELLFRSGQENFADPSIDGDVATSNVVTNSFLVIGLDKLTDGKKAFINFTDEMLCNSYPALFPREDIVVEVLEDVVVTPQLIKACRSLVSQGYVLALDDFIYKPEFDPLLELAGIVKFDIRAMSMAELARDVERVAPFGVRLLAEKVETQEEFEATKEMGFNLFQGYFFCKPEIVSGRDIPASKIQYLQLLRMVQDENYDFRKISDLISHNVALSFKLLRYVNSAYIGLRNKVKSLQTAVALIGELNIRKWLSLIMLSHMAEDKPLELVKLSIERASFCGRIGDSLPDKRFDSSLFFTVGMFSLLDVILGQKMEVILQDLNLADEIQDCLLGRSRDQLARTLALVKAYERGNWERVNQVSSALGVSMADLPGHFDGVLEEVRAFCLGD